MRHLKGILSMTLAFAMCLAALPLTAGGAAAQPASGGATFDLWSDFARQQVCPSVGRNVTCMRVDTRNIKDSDDYVVLQAESESPYATAFIVPPIVKPSGAGGKARSHVLVFCSPSTPEGTSAYIKITGTRAGEKHRLWLNVTALSSRPELKLSRGMLLFGEGYSDPVLQPYTGKPLTWKIAASNLGGAPDTYSLSASAGFPCKVRFLASNGGELSQVPVKGQTRNFLYPSKVEMKAEVTPLAPLPRNKPQEVTFTLGPGTLTGDTSSVTVKVFNPGMLFCMNAADGFRPHAHQVMAGEKTSFMFHVSNTGGTPVDVRLRVNGDPGGWAPALDRDRIRGLAPGATAAVLLRATAPADAAVGDMLKLTVVARNSLGAVEKAKIRAEVTDVPNIYYWSIDSMDPEYLYLDRAGTGPGSEGDWLMPNLRAFMSEGVNYSKAKVYLPAATDMNHTNALAGTYTGTSGIYMVSGTFRGFTEHDEVINAPNTMGLMRYGPDGKPIERVYEVAKAVTGGKSLGGFWSNKNWLTDIEAERTVDIAGHSERYPLFFPPPYKYAAAGDPQTDADPSDPLSGPYSMGFYSDVVETVIIPTLLGQFDLLLGIGVFTVPVSILTGAAPGGHSEDRYLYDSFERSVVEEDPDISYINVSDLDNTGHFTGASWTLDEWDTRGTPSGADDESKFSPWMRRDECLDIAREADVLFGRFIEMLKARGVYDNSVVIVLSDHGMENVKDPNRGYEVLDLRAILRKSGYVHWEDYHEGGGTQINFIWCDDADRCADIEAVLEGYTVEDPELGPVRPLTVINREEMLEGVDYGVHGKVRPRELYSEYWINHPDEPGGTLWPDLFVFPLYNYNIAAHGQVLSGAFNPVGVTLGNLPDSLQIGFPGAHGGLSTTDIPLVLKAPAGSPGYAPGTEVPEEVEVGDIAPTIYRILGWPEPGCLDGEPLP